MKKSFLRPQRSVKYPKSSAPNTAPAKYVDAIEPICSAEKFITCGSCSTPLTAPLRVTSRPSSVQVTPSATTMSQWNPLQGSRSNLAGTKVRNATVVAAGDVYGCATKPQKLVIDYSEQALNPGFGLLLGLTAH